MMELPSQNVRDLPGLTGHTKNKLRVMLVLHQEGNNGFTDDNSDLTDDLMPDFNHNTAPADDDHESRGSADDRLSTIPEGTNED